MVKEEAVIEAAIDWRNAKLRDVTPKTVEDAELALYRATDDLLAERGEEL